MKFSMLRRAPAISTSQSLSLALVLGGNERRRKADLSWPYKLAASLTPARSAAVVIHQLLG